MATHSRTEKHGRKLDSLKRDTFFAEHGWTKVPKLVQWMATGGCPLECPHCLAADERTKADMPIAAVASLIEQVADLGVDEFLLTGGEPLSRPDLPQVIEIMRANGVRWSLKTALMPNAELQRAIEDWPPGFVAVSVDGPPEVHDKFRGKQGAFAEAMASITYFDRLTHGNVAAGTTVTKFNFESLPITFANVLESRASMWGLHLLVPEGRAAHRNDLKLTSKQLKQLLCFAADKRKYFPVTMADEIGYCGIWEPFIRNEPFFCGAGKAQCVVLSDGEVVPCTTMDRSASAGNVSAQSLAEIWEFGFADIRNWSAEGECGKCRYSSACRGGCWLQSRHGKQCFRETWHVPEALTRYGLAISLGLAAASSTVSAQEDEEPIDLEALPLVGKLFQGRPKPTPEELASEAKARQTQILQRNIVRWYALATTFSRKRYGTTQEDVLKELHKKLPNDPGADFFIAFGHGKLPKELTGLRDSFSKACATKQRSLCLSGLMWRSVVENCLDAQAKPGMRSVADRAALRDAMTTLTKVTDAWHKEIIEDKLDPFLRRPAACRTFFHSKAGPWRHMFRAGINDDLAHKRGYIDKNRRPVDGAKLAKLRPFGASMVLTHKPVAGLNLFRGGKKMPADGTFRIFDILLTPADRDLKLTFAAGGETYAAALPRNAELAYGDILRLVQKQNGKALADLWINSHSRSTSPLLIPELRRRIKVLSGSEDEKLQDELQRVQWLLANLYLF